VLNRQVVAGPAEATAIGNLTVQLAACGQIAGAEQMGDMIRRSFDVQCYEPRDVSLWTDMYERYRNILRKA